MENWIVIAIVIVIIYLYASGKYIAILNMLKTEGPAAATVAPAAANETKAPAKESLETQLINDGISATNSEPESCTGELSFAKNDYGLPGIEFSDWAMNQTLDPRIVASNNQFVADRLGNPQTWTGATYSPDRHDTYDAVPWQGLSRPARVKVNSPDQIPDLDTSRYPETKKFRWNSNEVE